MTPRIHTWPLTAVACAAMLAACGGGGDDAPGATVENASFGFLSTLNCIKPPQLHGAEAAVRRLVMK